MIAIIAILAAILFPVFAKAREKARQISCASNMKQLGLGFMQYQQDNDEVLPNDGSGQCGAWGWAGRIYPYVKSTALYKCPGDSKTGTYPVSYTSDRNLSVSTGGWHGMSLSQMTAPASTVNLYETTNITTNMTNPTETSSDVGWGVGDSWGTCNTGQRQSTGPIGNPPYPVTAVGYGDAAFLTGRHTDGAEYLLCDGHVKYLKGAVVSAGPNPKIPGCNQYNVGNAACNGTTTNAASTDALSANNFQATFSTL